MTKNVPNALRSMKGKHKIKKMNEYVRKHSNKAKYDPDSKRLTFGVCG